MTGSPHSQVYVVDDDAAVRASLGALLEAAGLGARVFASAEEFLATVDEGTRGCLLLDVRMPGMSGLELQRVLQDRGVRIPVIIITGHGDIAMAVRAMKAGAADFLEKPFEPRVLLDRIRGCLEDEARAHVQVRHVEEVTALLDRLTGREREVLELMVTGHASKAIAFRLGISEKTVDVHRFNLMKKTGARSVAELVRLWLRVHPGELG
jgi:two-component system response regulator FixJ